MSVLLWAFLGVRSCIGRGGSRWWRQCRHNFAEQQCILKSIYLIFWFFFQDKKNTIIEKIETWYENNIITGSISTPIATKREINKCLFAKIKQWNCLEFPKRHEVVHAIEHNQAKIIIKYQYQYQTKNNNIFRYLPWHRMVESMELERHLSF